MSDYKVETPQEKTQPTCSKVRPNGLNVERIFYESQIPSADTSMRETALVATLFACCN